MRRPGITKLRIALAAVLTGAVLLGPAARCASAATPAADDIPDEPVYLIKGYGQDLAAPASRWSCATRWSYRMSFVNDGKTGSRTDGASPIQATQNSLFRARRW